MNRLMIVVVSLGFAAIRLINPLSAYDNDNTRSTESSTTKLLVPAYFYPAGDGLETWNRLIAAQNSASKIDIVVIANINSGNVGTVLDSNYKDVIRRAVKGKLKVIGYITSDYANLHGNSSLETARTNVTNWFNLYPELHGVFIDEQTADASAIDSYYIPLRRHIDSVKPQAIVVGNPGNNCVEDYLAKRPGGPIMDVVIIHENNETTVPYASAKPAAWMSAYSADRFAMLVHSSKTYAPHLKLAKKNNTGYVFVTDVVGPPPETIHPWGKLPGYWDDELKLVSEMNIQSVKKLTR